ncbi:MAG: glutaminyl-peptide cyclotransferase [Prolixibacteraceae bacterium]
MKLKIFSILVISLIFLSAFSCTNSSERSRKPVVKIVVTPNKKNLVSGDSVSVRVAVKIKDGELEKSALYLDNELIETSDNTEFDYLIKNFKTLGKHQIKVVATKSDGVEGVSFQSLEILSDIEPEMFGYKIINSYPHNTEHFTQGLEIHQDVLYESTGENGKSGIFKKDLTTGKILKSVKLEDKYFGEGISILNDKIYQLTYKSQIGFVYDLNTFARIDSFTYKTPQGWGLTNDQKFLIKTDGTEVMHFINPADMEVIRRVPVYDNQGPVQYLNELEYYDGYVYANIFTTNLVVKIDPETGKVISKINLEGLLPVTYDPKKPVDVLNGIAINKENGKFYVTGKLWPFLFEVGLIKKD